tara:strand:+ start:17336 stop:17476 length:141 start_codon:yes stop_codon:yes gene_type:complete
MYIHYRVTFLYEKRHFCIRPFAIKYFYIRQLQRNSLYGMELAFINA